MISSNDYVLIHLDTEEGFVVERDLWLRALSAAKQEGWEPEGTRYDFGYIVDEKCDPLASSMQNLYTVLLVHDEHLGWNGNYEEKKDQIVTEEDSYFMGQALQGTAGMRDLAEFLKKGGFRILSV